MNSKMIFAASLAATAQISLAAIVADGLWTGNDWYDATAKFGVRNGVPYSDDAAVDRRITSPLSRDGPDPNYMQADNVQRVQRVFTEADWNTNFPFANALYSYTDFLKAVAKFPAFCGEAPTGENIDQVCQRELSTIFAHWAQETGLNDASNAEPIWKQALYWIKEIRCDGTNDASCNYKD